MTKEEAISYFKMSISIGDTDDERQHNEALKMAIEALEQEPCEDVVSRQAAIDALKDAENHAFNSYYKGLVKAHKIIANLPPIQPKIGHWIDVETLDSALWHACSECGETEFYETDYCPNCGRRMQEVGK
jgi:hypothetical protein